MLKSWHTVRVTLYLCPSSGFWGSFLLRSILLLVDESTVFPTLFYGSLPDSSSFDMSDAHSTALPHWAYPGKVFFCYKSRVRGTALSLDPSWIDVSLRDLCIFQCGRSNLAISSAFFRLRVFAPLSLVWITLLMLLSTYLLVQEQSSTSA